MKSITPSSISVCLGYSERIFQNNLGKLVADEWANTLEDTQAFVEAPAADMIQIKMPA